MIFNVFWVCLKNNSVLGAAVCATLAARGSVAVVVQVLENSGGDFGSGRDSVVMKLACTAFFSSMSNCMKV